MPPTRSPYRILFVCLGNICRSPAAEILFRKLADEAGRQDDFVIDSAGTGGHFAGHPPDPRMAACLEARGFEVTGSARQVQSADFNRFDLILPMDESNHAELLARAPSAARAEIRPFVSFCQHHDEARVPDPYYGGQRGFERVIELLEDGCRGILEFAYCAQETTSSEPL